MPVILVKDRKEVCSQRAEADASAKYDHLVQEKREQYSAKKEVKIMQEIIKLSRQRAAFKREAFEYHMANYKIAADSVSDSVPEKIKKSYGLKEFSDYMIEELNKL